MSEERLDSRGDPIPDNMHEYAFDVKLFAVVRVVAANKRDAIKAMEQTIDALDLSDAEISGLNSILVQGLRITEVSLAEDGEDDNRTPFEIDGEPV